MSTANKKEIDKFSKLAQEWWDPFGKFKPLHKFNPIRLKFIRDKSISHFKLNKNSNEPLKDLNILDIGCGGGLLSEPIARLGAKVTGIDASQENIEIAKTHAKKMGIKINYIHNTPEKIKFNRKFDIILNMEVVEHVENLDLFIKSCSNALNKNCIMFVATINRTLRSYLQAIVGAEYILRWLPIGTHDWNSFLTPAELKNLALKNNLNFDDLTGIKFDLLSSKWRKSYDTNVNYIITFIKT